MTPTGPQNAKLLVAIDCLTYEDERRRAPLTGIAGNEFSRLMQDAGLFSSQAFITSVLRSVPPGGDIERLVSRKKKASDPFQQSVNGLWLSPSIIQGIEKLKQEIRLCQPAVVIVLGNVGLWALTGQWGIKNWRGSTIKSELDGHHFIVIPTYHPELILRAWNWRPYVVTDLKRVAKVLKEGLVVPQYNFIIRPQLDQVTSCLLTLYQRANVAPIHLSVDIETRLGHIDCLGIAWSTTEAISIPFLCYGQPEGYWPEESEYAILSLIRRLLLHPNVYVSGQNWSYDAQYIFRHWGVVARLGLDTMVSHHLLFPGTDKGLDILSSLYCSYHLYWKEENKEANLSQDDNQRWTYNATDCVRTFEIAEVLAPILEEQGLREQAITQHKTWWLAFTTMIRGVRVASEEKNALSLTLASEYKHRSEWLTSVLGHPINIGSPLKMKELFYGDFQLKPVINRKTGAPTLNDEALAKLYLREPIIRPLVRRIREMRSLGVFRSTFVEARLDRDGRLRSSYNIAGTETFRFSSSTNPFGSGLNLQNIPKGDNPDEPRDIDDLILPNVRQLFIPDEGYEMFDMDLDSADLRIVVWESDETEMKAMLAEGKKVYVEVMKEYYHDQSLTKNSPMYGAFKSLCHGTHYLGKAKGIAPRIGLLVHEVERIQKWYFGKFPRIEKWQGDLVKQLDSTRQVRNAFGYRRFYFDRIEGNLYNQAVAWIPQSSVGLLINKIWQTIDETLPQVQILLQVHDSLVGQYPIAQAAATREALKKTSHVVIPYADPLIIPTGFVHSQKSWGDCR